MDIFSKIVLFLKKYYLDFSVFFVGGILSLILQYSLSNSTTLVGIIATFFVETSLLAIRQEARKIAKETSSERIEHIAQDLHRLHIISDATSFAKKLKSSQYEQAVETELSRTLKAFSELENGKRRIYKKDDLYNEQKDVILATKSQLLTIHVVQDLEDLYRWDPDKMNKDSVFYSILYNTFKAISSKPLSDRRRIVILPEKGLREIMEFNSKLKPKQREYLFKSQSLKDKSVESQRLMLLYYDSISRIVADQDQLNFQVKFITSAKAVAEHRAIFDCIISDSTHLFEFSKADSMDVRAYVIDKKDSIKERIDTFDILWNAAEKWE